MSGQPFQSTFDSLFRRVIAAEFLDLGAHLASAKHDQGSPLAVLAEQGEPMQIQGMRRKGGALFLDLAVTILDDKDQFAYILLIRDVTAKKRAEARAAKARQQLTACRGTTPFR